MRCLRGRGPADAAGAQAQSCPGDGNAPTPTAVTVTAVPIVVGINHRRVLRPHARLNGDAASEVPLAVVRGQDGTTVPGSIRSERC